jgi:shikimate dehydrogenase
MTTSFEKILAEAQGRPFAAIVGWPVELSRSPALHGYWLKQHSIQGYYGRLPVEPKPEALRELVAFLKRTPNARGCNLTLPHKIDIMPLLDRIDPVARRIGAVNTVIKRADGSLEGRNSDGAGFLSHLRASAPSWNPEAGPVVVLGSGGAARAIVCTLMDAGVRELRLVNRTQAAAATLAQAFTPADGRRIEVAPWEERSKVLDGAALLVNSAAIGMTGKSPLEIDLARLPTSAVVDDIVYIPLETDLLAKARARGNVCVDGLGMLLHQGRVGFEAWFGKKVEATADQRKAVLAA